MYTKVKHSDFTLTNNKSVIIIITITTIKIIIITINTDVQNGRGYE